MSKSSQPKNRRFKPHAEFDIKYLGTVKITLEEWIKNNNITGVSIYQVNYEEERVELALKNKTYRELLGQVPAGIEIEKGDSINTVYAYPTDILKIQRGKL